MLHALLSAACSFKLPALDLKLPSPSLAEDGRFGGGGYATALRVCADVLSSPNDSGGWRELGTLLHGKGRLDASAMALRRATQIEPLDSEAHVALAEVLRAAGRFEEAFASLRTAEAIDGRPNQALCYAGYGDRGGSSRGGGATSATDAVDFDALARRVGEVWLTEVASEEECEWVIATAEEHNAAKGGWACRQPRFAPEGTVANAVRAPDMLVADEPRLLAWLNEKCDHTILPALEAQFGIPARELWLYDTFLLKFSGTPGESGLGVHVDDDGFGLSFNVLLSDPADFEGGGTRFPPNAFSSEEAVYTPRRGQMLSHYGGLRHASVPCTGGLRYIMVGFVRAERLVELRLEDAAYGARTGEG
mmetsp:Transcript_1185/g.3750  ORF Transcript_1185/g.3750 Transcript_1185/m.3750 type:complete len:363 (-) Transcript_1185:130-1218(-)